ncbi:MAG: glucosaminidase domain-containing protein [Actinobacteria bacterium]|nr:glucosaminidase domain-containing protein [Actinomycetota bacterium]
MSYPLAGMGKVFIQAQERTGVSASLLVALTLAESSCATAGSLSITNHNAWGMKGPQPALGIPAENGYCLWYDWPSAVNGAADFIVHYWGSARTGHDLRGYEQ